MTWEPRCSVTYVLGVNQGCASAAVERSQRLRSHQGPCPSGRSTSWARFQAIRATFRPLPSGDHGIETWAQAFIISQGQDQSYAAVNPFGQWASVLAKQEERRCAFVLPACWARTQGQGQIEDKEQFQSQGVCTQNRWTLLPVLLTCRVIGSCPFVDHSGSLNSSGFWAAPKAWH